MGAPSVLHIRVTQNVLAVYNWNRCRTSAIGQRCLLTTSYVRGIGTRIDCGQVVKGRVERGKEMRCDHAQSDAWYGWLAYGVADSLRRGCCCCNGFGSLLVAGALEFVLRPYRVMLKVALIPYGPSRTISFPSQYHASRFSLFPFERFLAYITFFESFSIQLSYVHFEIIYILIDI